MYTGCCVQQIRRLSQISHLLLSKKAGDFLQNASTQLTAVKTQNNSSQIRYWEQITCAAKEFQRLHNDYVQLKNFQKVTDEELRAYADEDCSNVEAQLDELAQKLARAIVPLTEFDSLQKCQMEFTAGVGGTEAMLFTGELISMYEKLADRLQFKWLPLHVDHVQLGGVRSAVILISGKDAYRTFRFEAGVHRVQRMPVTDKTRMHTSTASISVLPEPDRIESYLSSKDVKVETIRASGPGGQNVNKRATAVRLTHKETGIIINCMDERFQHMNLQIAYRRLAAILMQRKQDAQFEKISTARKIQMGTRGRAEKVRTYNFRDDRVTDHRLHKSYTSLHQFMSIDNDSMINLIEQLNTMFLLEQLEDKLTGVGGDEYS